MRLRPAISLLLIIPSILLAYHMNPNSVTFVGLEPQQNGVSSSCNALVPCSTKTMNITSTSCSPYAVSCQTATSLINRTSTQFILSNTTEAVYTQSLSVTTDKTNYFCGENVAATALLKTNNMNPPVGGVVSLSVVGPPPSNVTIAKGPQPNLSYNEMSEIYWTQVAGGYDGKEVFNFTLNSACSAGVYTVYASLASFVGASSATTTFVVSQGLSVTGTVTYSSYNRSIVTAPNPTTSTNSSSPVPGTKCLIATASYGSELAPEVQLLRDLRDNYVMKTKAGFDFMIVFNAWYYSFSPRVATYLNGHWFERSLMKVVLYPLIGILWISLETFRLLPLSDFTALASGLVATGLIGSFYVGLPLSLVAVKTRRVRKKQRTVGRVLAVVLFSGLTLLLASELSNSTFFMMLSTSVIVLSNLALSGVLSSRVFVRLFSR